MHLKMRLAIVILFGCKAFAQSANSPELAALDKKVSCPNAEQVKEMIIHSNGRVEDLWDEIDAAIDREKKLRVQSQQMNCATQISFHVTDVPLNETTSTRIKNSIERVVQSVASYPMGEAEATPDASLGRR